MLNRVTISSARSKIQIGVRRLSVFDYFNQKQEETKTTPNPDEELQNNLNKAKEVLNGGGGLQGKMLNMAMKPMFDKMGGKENVEKLMSDPKFMEHARLMMKDPAAMAKAQEAMKEFMKNGTMPKQ